MKSISSLLAKSAETLPPQRPVLSKPATFHAQGYEWFPHTPGDPMPCDGEAQIYTLLECEFKDGLFKCVPTPASKWEWQFKGSEYEIIGWRYATPPQEKDELTRLREENASMRKAVKEGYAALKSFEHEDGCYCEAAFCMGSGAHPRHSKECEAAKYALTKLQPFTRETK